MPELPIVVLGIDPGGSGGLALLPAEPRDAPDFEHNFIAAYPMPESPRDLHDLLAEHRHKIIMATMEDVHAMPTNGSISGFKLGRNAGWIEGFLIALKIPYEKISPQKWTKHLSLVGGKPGTEKKNLHKVRAQQWFPNLKITHATADALLIAEYARRKRLGL